MSSPAPPLRRSGSAPPSRMSLPEPPSSRSRPASPDRRSLPAPPSSASSPVSPNRPSLPLPPSRRSSPGPPNSWSSPVPPSSRSSPSWPKMVSLPCSAGQMVVERRAVDHVVPGGSGDDRPDAALRLRAIHIRGGAGREIIQPVGWRAEAKADAHAGHDHRAAIGAGRGCPSWRHQRSARRARGQGCRRGALARRQRVEDLAAGRCRRLAGKRPLRGGTEPGRRQVVMPCCARFAVAGSRGAAARCRRTGSGIAQSAFALREQNADQGRGQRRADRQAVEIEPWRPGRASPQGGWRRAGALDRAHAANSYGSGDAGLGSREREATM